jgi:hypothetical protein
LQNQPNNKVGQDESQEIHERKQVRKRIYVLLLMIYLAVMVNVAKYIGGNIFEGFYFPYPGRILFPIPFDLGWFGHYIVSPVLVPLNPVEFFIYLVFIYQGVWIFWMAIGILYVMLPWSPRLQTFVGNLKSKISHY